MASPLVGNAAWTWFHDPRAVYHEGTHKRTYVTWIESDGWITVGAYDHDDQMWHVGQVAQFGQDDHNVAALHIRDDGRIVAAYIPNAGTVRCKISTNPEDVTAWGDEVVVASGDNNYPNLVHLSGEGGGTLYLFYRQQGGGLSRSHRFRTSTDGGDTWSAETTLLSSSGRPYLKIGSNGVDRMDFAFSEAHPNDDSSAGIRHMYYDGAWRASDGTDLGTPSFSMSNLTLVYDASEDPPAWPWDCALDGSDPVIVFASMPHVSNDHRYHYAKWNGTGWDEREILAAGSSIGVDSYNAGLVLDHADPNIAYVCHEVVTGRWELEKWTTADEGDNWTTEAITADSPTSPWRTFRPVVPRGGGPIDVLYCAGYYTHWTNYQAAVFAHPAVDPARNVTHVALATHEWDHNAAERTRRALRNQGKNAWIVEVDDLPAVDLQGVQCVVVARPQPSDTTRDIIREHAIDAAIPLVLGLTEAASSTASLNGTATRLGLCGLVRLAETVADGVVINDDTHPIAGELTGAVTTHEGNNWWGAVRDDEWHLGDLVALGKPGTSLEDHFDLFAIEAGTHVDGEPINVRVACSGLVYGGQTAYTTDGEVLLAQMVEWVTAHDPPGLQVEMTATAANLSWHPSPTADVEDYAVFRRSPPTGEPFDPDVDTPIASGITGTSHTDGGLQPITAYEWKVFGRIPGTPDEWTDGSALREGVVTSPDPEAKVIDVLTASTTWQKPEHVDWVEVLVVAGGGGGGSRQGGGGGGGGVLYSQSVHVTDDVAVVVGAGGAGGVSGGRGTDGQGSSFGSIETVGGGAGGGRNGPTAGNDGGSGGGGANGNVGGSGTGGEGDPVQGHDGGDGAAVQIAGGGGGGSEPGDDGQGGTSDGQSGHGGDGLDFSAIFGTAVGVNGWFSGGGGGGSAGDGALPGDGGQGGGGDGGRFEDDEPGDPGVPDSGGGGGGAGPAGEDGGLGGSGVIIVAYAPEETLVPVGRVYLADGSLAPVYLADGSRVPLYLADGSRL